MDYQRIYDQLIEKRKLNIPKGYVEKHHILPKCAGGLNNIENLVKLTAREHYLAHWLLHKIYPDNLGLICAIQFMVNGHQKEHLNISSREFERIKIKRSELLSKRMSGENHPRYGKKNSDYTNLKIKEGRKNYFENGGREINSKLRKKYFENIENLKRNRNQKTNKIFTIDNNLFNSLGDAVRRLKIPKKTVLNRLRSENFNNYQYV